MIVADLGTSTILLSTHAKSEHRLKFGEIDARAFH